MSSYMGDISNYFAAGSATSAAAAMTKKASDSYELDMQDFLTLMVTELQSQSIDSTADTSEMLNQMVMMQMVSALTNMTDASIMSYAASLVGKTVTVGQYDSEGNLEEIVGEVTGTGTMGGEQVVFVNDKYYYMNEIMAVGTLPKIEETETPEDSGMSGTPETPAVPETSETPESSGTSEVSVPEAPEVSVPEVPEVSVPEVAETSQDAMN